jgi:hypothetical protein
VNELVHLIDVYIYRGGPHSSWSDPKRHVTVRVKTAEQVANNTHQVAHVYSTPAKVFIFFTIEGIQSTDYDTTQQ